ncbi:predicted protein [Phaeodactylum tricornutum CCAP 1055/1]|uniref:Aspartyl/asparaginy/proline hydroxylase domain-containing protein n=1 Tax=Phaeodactylum tricornutum (strain CCAP 1055/1) TaxID=556484 RepID=B7FZY7_PHATC|nr:predicted protein [Phaeodactylum tricornutum CCAP 1055/1]EEC47991.1 predicted protein [Phaeodactylum tricornutum CCAP 1055/1]|eukprot:XP_002180583.1 predicted protein [Phaeodactylum tricornutum CCAP 1055/1]
MPRWHVIGRVMAVAVGFEATSSGAFSVAPRRRSSPRSFPLAVRPSSTTAASLPQTTPLPKHTFAGMVEHGIRERFGDHADRVIESWRLLDQDYEHQEFVGSGDPETSNCHQWAHSYVPGLSIQEFWDTAEFGWCQRLESKYKAIRKEFLAVTADMERLTREGNNVWAGALTEDASSYGEGWKTLVLMNRGRWDPVNVNLFPVTSQAIHDCHVPAAEVFFASMKPNSAIQRHSDFTNFVLTSHLALDIPYSGQNKCRLTIGDTTREWINGQVSMFDTSLMHDAVNEADQTRYILMMRVWHPDLTEAERNALQFTFDCLETPELVSEDPGQRFLAEREVQASRSFPQIKRDVSRVVGFGGKAKGGAKKNKAKASTGGGRGFS